jgi:hypothetical protein
VRLYLAGDVGVGISPAVLGRVPPAGRVPSVPRRGRILVEFVEVGEEDVVSVQ